MIKKIFFIRYSIYFFLLLLLPACNRYGVWLRNNVYQGNKIDISLECIKRAMRSLHIYEQFSTLAHFDILWLSDEVRSFYAWLHAEQHCFLREAYEQLLQEQYNLNKNTISFYVIAAIENTLGSPLLTASDADWQLCLQIEDVFYKPRVIQEIEMEPEYKLFFDKKYSRFKKVYRVDFDLSGIEKGMIMKLWFNRLDRKVVTQWQW